MFMSSQLMNMTDAFIVNLLRSTYADPYVDNPIIYDGNDTSNSEISSTSFLRNSELSPELTHLYESFNSITFLLKLIKKKTKKQVNFIV